MGRAAANAAEFDRSLRRQPFCYARDAASFGKGADAAFLDRRADEFEFRGIKLDAGLLEQLVEKQSALKVTDRAAIGFSDSVHVIGPDQVAGTRHVFDYDCRLSLHVFAKVTRDGSSVSVEAAAGRSRDDHADGFALVETLLGERRARQHQHDGEHQIAPKN